MITELRVKNYKSWGTDNWGDMSDMGDKIRLAPVTVFLGRNSTGKSCLLETLRIVKQNLNDQHPDLDIDQLNLKSPLFLGKIENIIRYGSNGFGIGFTVDTDGKQTKVTSEYFLEKEPSLVYSLDRCPDIVSTFKPHRSESIHGFVYTDTMLQKTKADARNLLAESISNVRTVMGNIYFLGEMKSPKSRVFWENTSNNGNGTNTLNDILQVLLSIPNKDSLLLDEVNNWLKDLGIADSISIKNTADPYFYNIMAHHGDVSLHIADESSSFTQVLSLILFMLSIPKKSVLILDNPTIFSHPILHAKLADMITTIAANRNYQTLIITHSEQFFRRLQYQICDETLNKKDVIFYYIRKDNVSSITELITDNFGRIKEWPEHFFGDSVDETGRHMRRMVERLKIN